MDFGWLVFFFFLGWFGWLVGWVFRVVLGVVGWVWVGLVCGGLREKTRSQERFLENPKVVTQMQGVFQAYTGETVAEFISYTCEF